MLAAYMVLSFYNFHERSEFTSIFTSTLTSETSVRLFCLQSYVRMCNSPNVSVRNEECVADLCGESA